MKRNGQALVEFIIVLPILIIILLGIIDFGMIFSKKSFLENTLDEVMEIWKKDKSMDSINIFLDQIDENIEFEIVGYDNFTEEFVLSLDYEIITPGLNLILDNPYEIKVNRVMYNG